MSAHVVDPATIDYLVAWITGHARSTAQPRTCRLWRRLEDVPRAYRGSIAGSEDYGYSLVLTSLQRDELGRVLMAECVRSVRHRYPDTAPDDLPGPVDQRRVWSYTYRPVPVDQIRQAWVVSCCECLRYQSCETPDYTATLGHAVMEAIREDAIQAMIEDAPWGVTDARLGRTPALA